MGARSVFPLAKKRTAPRMGRTIANRPHPAAVRIPTRLRGQLALAFPSAAPQLFVHEGARQSLERRLTAAFPGPVAVSITDNRHAMITHRMHDGVLRARIHHMFLGAPPAIVDALIRYVTRGEREASLLIGNYIEENGAQLSRRSRRVPLLTRGKTHDLLRVFSRVNEKYFGGSVNALITWGKPGTRRGKSRSTIKLGSYSAVEKMIRVHPSLDRGWVPRYFLEYIVYHEMLHHVIPASRGPGRSMFHPPEFRDREKAFRHFERALQWERSHLGRLLRS